MLRSGVAWFAIGILIVQMQISSFKESARISEELILLNARTLTLQIFILRRGALTQENKSHIFAFSPGLHLGL